MRSALMSLLFDVMMLPSSPPVHVLVIAVCIVALTVLLSRLFIVPLRNVKYFADDDSELAFAFMACAVLAAICVGLDLDLIGWIFVSLITFRFLQGKSIGVLARLPAITKLKAYIAYLDISLIALTREIDCLERDVETSREEMERIRAGLSITKYSFLVAGPFVTGSMLTTLYLTAATSLCQQLFLFFFGRKEWTEIPLVTFGHVGTSLFLQSFSAMMVLLFCDASAMQRYFRLKIGETQIAQAKAYIGARCAHENLSVLKVLSLLTLLILVLASGTLTYMWWYFKRLILG